MAINLSKIILLTMGMASVAFDTNAATATATVTANIVPASSFSISESIQLSTAAEKNNDVQQTLINNNRIEISSLNSKDAVKVKIISGHNNTYDLSISSKSILTSSKSSNKLEIDSLKLHKDTPSLNHNNEQGLIIEGVLTKPDSKSTGPYSGITEITVNYN